MKLVQVLVSVGLAAGVACSNMDSTLPPGGGDAGGGGGGDAVPDADLGPGGEPAEVTGCDGATLYELPADPSRRGPWPVGARTVSIGRLTAEVWYPATRGSQEGLDRAVYDIREALPPSQRELIPDADNPWQQCDCYRDLPLDTERGPYPVVVFVHGTAAFRTQSLQETTHWASRGFVVVAADHPGLMLGDMLSLLCPDSASGQQNLTGDMDAILTALDPPTGELAFLAGAIDTERVAAIGHSAGGNAVAGFSGKPGVRVVIPFSAGTAVQASPSLEQTLFVSGMSDAIAKFDSVVTGYDGSPAPKRLVGIRSAGHLVVSDLCALRNSAGRNMLEVAQDHGVCGTGLAGGLFDCDPGYIDGETGWAIVEYATSGVLETALHCTDRSAALAEIQSRFPDVGDYREAP